MFVKMQDGDGESSLLEGSLNNVASFNKNKHLFKILTAHIS